MQCPQAYTLVQKSPNKAYVADRLWIPKNGVRVEPVLRSLEFFVAGKNGKQFRMNLWEDSPHHIVAPREFIPTEQYCQYPFPFVDLRPEFERVEFEDLVLPRDERQERAWIALAAHDNGIFNLACGIGKTKLALKKVAQRATPTIIVVPDGHILKQWEEAILGGAEDHPGLRFDGSLGYIRGKQFGWQAPIVLALVTTLWRRILDGAMPEEALRRFGLVIYDEVHQIAAPKFSLTAARFYGDRIGLTATVTREDGLTPIYLYHIGRPFYTDLQQDLVPRVYFQQTAASIPLEGAKDSSGLLNISMLRSMLGMDIVGNTARYWAIREALDSGRKLLCISHSKNQLRLLHAMFPEAALLIQDTAPELRKDLLRNSRVCFAIARLGSTGVDDDRLDTLFWLTPFRSRISLQQSIGRIQRERSGKMTPVVTFFEEPTVPPLRKLCNAIRAAIREGGMTSETLRPGFLRPLPDDVRARYTAEFARLTLENE